MQRLIGGLLAMSFCAGVAAQSRPDPTVAEEPASRSELVFTIDPDAYSIVDTAKGLSTHKPTYFYPFTYADEYHGDTMEMVFQVSAKWALPDLDVVPCDLCRFYVAYSQRSYWQWVNGDASSPFRETNYDPEVFLRLDPNARRKPGERARWNYWAMDVGVEHESNGRPYPQSRSWNRVYVAPFQAKGKGLAYLKFWYRIPEDEPSTLENQDGDDNPDITDYMGYGEINYSRQIGGTEALPDQLVSVMVRGNPATGRGAVGLTWSVPFRRRVFLGLSAFHGYGESLILYDHEITRVMLGVMFSR